ncbi:hypothetical protein CL654_00430 [bacterium]|nr:hypothetical protein [bacterium]|tara:strand:+ start:1798 stop:2211 length:414 start_codon:yes stop_codon:yes gene_type:complete
MELQAHEIKKPQNGFVTLISILIVSSVSVLLVLSQLEGGIARTQNRITGEQGATARGHANTCIEEALEEIRELESYTGSNSIAFSLGSCEWLVTNTGGENRTIRATGTVDTVHRNVEVQITAIDPYISISSWNEVVD